LMQEHWKKILKKLTAKTGTVTCHQCQAEIKKEHFHYRNTMNLLNIVGRTTVGNVDVYNYKLPSAHRADLMKYTFIQPTIFYFACPHCSFFHQYKSSLEHEDT
jgi:hypothetical protein